MRVDKYGCTVYGAGADQEHDVWQAPEDFHTQIEITWPRGSLTLLVWLSEPAEDELRQVVQRLQRDPRAFDLIVRRGDGFGTKIAHGGVRR